MGSASSGRTSENPNLREYDRARSIVFLKTAAAFGGLSNMAPGYPVRVNDVAIRSSEALYQACRFPHLPDVQARIIAQTSPMTAKMVGKPHRGDSRPDWDSVRTRIMRWCIRVKLAQNFEKFSNLLHATGELPIVEESRKDDFWGAKPDGPKRLVGANVLGRLLMELRQELRERGNLMRELPAIDLPQFHLLGRPIEAKSAATSTIEASKPRPEPVPALPFDRKEFMPSPVRKKLIEVSIPLEAINVASAREKSIRHGHPSTLHLWWARRPLAACRAILFAQLVDDPSAWPDKFPSEMSQEVERRRLHKVIESIVLWEASNDEVKLNAARWEIARSVAWGLGEEPPAKDDGKAILDYLQTKAPPVYDPFSGGGSIPLEAQRLGLRAFGSDLNPVAVLIGKALVEIPPKFAGMPPVNPKVREDRSLFGREWKGAQGIAEDVRFYGQWMRDEAERRIGRLYPKASHPDGRDLTAIAWLWARTVRSPDPSAKGAMVPLVGSFMLSTKEGKKAWVEPIIDVNAPDGWRFDVKSGALPKASEERLKKGTKTGRGTNFECILTGSAITPDHVRTEGKAGRLDSRLMAIVAEGRKGRSGVFGEGTEKGEGRIYLSPTAEHENIARKALPVDLSGLEVDMPDNPRWFSPPGYGMTRFVDIFTPRQLVALTTFSDLVGEAREKVLAHSRAAGLANDEKQLHDSGGGAAAYADAVATYLAFTVTNIADRNATVVGWANNREHARNVFARQAIAMVWDYCESNVLSDSSGNFFGGVEKVANVLYDLVPAGLGAIKIQAAQTNGFSDEPVLISTDPPYYDNIGYADLSDFFYVWLRKSASVQWPELFRRLAVPKAEELVATPYRHGGKDQAEAFFMKGMAEALLAMRNAATDAAPLAIYYAFKQAEASAEGVTSAGWASFLQAVVDAGLVVDGTWPVRTELERRLVGRDANALASSVVLVCRKRPVSAETLTRAEFIRALKKEMPDAIDAIRKAGVGPVDMQQSIIGPAMGVFSRCAKVLENDDSAMSVKTALSVINRVWEEIENELDANFDAETQVALAWFASYGFDTKASGELTTLANAKNIPDRALHDSGIFQNLHGKTALSERDKLASDWTPSLHSTVWECVQQVARVLNAPDGGGEAAARLVAQMGSKAADAQKLAYRLFEIATQKGWASEALVYNELAQEWTRLEDLAATVPVRDTVAKAQAEMLF